MSEPKMGQMADHGSQGEPVIRLDLGCGQRVRQGFEGVDFFAPAAKHQINLMKFPWPWADNSVDELYSCHFLEHIPMVYIGPEGDYAHCPATPAHRDLLFRFMDECWRIMKAGATFTVIVPSGRSSRGFQDPTHRRFFVGETFAYFNAAWRRQHGIEHYMGACDFSVNVQNRVKTAFAALPPEEQQARAENHWNSVQDFAATLVAIK